MGFNLYELYNIRYFLESNQEIVTQALIFLLLFTLILIILKRTLFQEQKDYTWAVVISAIVSALAIYSISRTQLMTIIESYNIVGSVILFTIPLAIILAVVHKTNTEPKFRKIVVVIYGILYFYILSAKDMETSGIMDVVAISVLAAAFFFDSSIHTMFNPSATPTDYSTVVPRRG